MNRRVVAFAVATGGLTGVVVAGFERLVGTGMLEHLLDGPLWLQAIGPFLGLTGAALALRFLAASATPATADEYIRGFHTPERLPARPVIGRLVASASTLGLGAAMGFEGPSLYAGASIGDALQRRFSSWFSRDDSKALLVAGAAAGVAAIFKAPATGALFALEVPYQDDLARHMLLPALFGAASGYVTYVAINDTAPLFPISTTPPFDLRDLGGAALVGLAAGIGARLFSALLRWAKTWPLRLPLPVRVGGAGAAALVLFVACRLLTGESLVIGAGYNAITWSLDPDHATLVVLAVLLLRALATVVAVAGGGAGGLFIPLVVEGALLGRVLGGLFGGDPTLFPVLGVAAFLGAGYRVPLAAVVFVAETTGRPGFVVPGLIAAAVAQLAMGRASVSTYQRTRRAGHLERRVDMPLTAALRTDVMTAAPDTTLDEFVGHHVTELRQRVVPVVDGKTYLGMVHLIDVAAIEPERRATTTVANVMHADDPAIALRSTLRDALAAMERADVDRVAVIDDDAFVGVVTVGEILKLDEVLDATDDE